jgi:MoaA/NifB/PqqE/SkfB family radical SAM enzyme
MNNFYCAAPWRGLHINPRGDVKTCCAGDPNMLGNLNEHSIEQILHSPIMQEIRQSMRAGQPHAYCYNCVQAERYGRSERDWHNSVSPEFDPRTAGDCEHVPVLIDVRWNTTCNLSCNYCGDKCSSKWAALKHIPFKSGARPYYEQVCDYLEQHQEHIREVALVGGEPLLLPENERLLDVIPNDCIVTLITNMSVDLENNKIFAKLAQRRRVGWSMSFDNVDARFEYVRHGASWTQLEHNIDLVQNLMHNHGHWGGIHAVYNIYNATQVQALTKFARHKGLTIHWQILHQPEFLDPAKLGSDTVALARLELTSILDSDWCVAPEQQFLQSVLENLQVKDDLRTMLKQHTREIENLYHKDQQGKFAELWPELDVVLKEVPDVK